MNGQAITVTYVKWPDIIEAELGALRCRMPNLEWEATEPHRYQAEDLAQDKTWFAKFSCDSMHWVAMSFNGEFLAGDSGAMEFVEAELAYVLGFAPSRKP